jgi:hypothetical protein
VPEAAQGPLDPRALRGEKLTCAVGVHERELTLRAVLRRAVVRA